MTALVVNQFCHHPAAKRQMVIEGAIALGGLDDETVANEPYRSQ